MRQTMLMFFDILNTSSLIIRPSRVHGAVYLVSQQLSMNIEKSLTLFYQVQEKM